MNLLYFFAEHRSPLWDLLQTLAMNIGSEIFLMIFICFLYWTYRKDIAYRIGFTYFFSCLLVQGLKITFRIPRPWQLDPQFTALPEAVPSATGYSFPSGHSQTATAIFGGLIPIVKKSWVRILCVLLFLLVGWSRMYAGVHTPLDVSVGILSTLVIVFLLAIYYRKTGTKAAPYGLPALLLILVSILIFGYAILSYQVFSLVDYENVSDLVKCCGSAFAFGLGYHIESKYVQFSTEGTLLHKLLRLVIGLLVLVGIKAGLKPLLLPLGLIGDFLRYALMILWVMVLYPWIFQKINR